MKRLLPLLLCCLLLCGCAQESALTKELPEPEARSRQLYHPDTEVERRTGGAVTVHPVTIPDAGDILALGDQLLLVSGGGRPKLTVLSGELLTVTAQAEQEAQAQPFLIPGSQTFALFRDSSRELLVMDTSLDILRRIAAPEDLVGMPLLSADGSTVYYCTAGAVRAWDLKSGIRRTVTELACEGQTLTGLYLQDTVLGCTVTDRGQTQTLFLSTDNGRQLHCREGHIRITDSADRYSAVFSSGPGQILVFGTGEASAQALVPVLPDSCLYPLPGAGQAVSACTQGKNTVLDLYDLESGRRLSTLSLPGPVPTAVTGTADGFIYILMHDEAGNCETIYRWDPEALPVTDEAVYTGPHYTADNPDIQGLAHCQALADSLSEKYGISIRIWKDAVAVQPWDYDLEEEYCVSVLTRQLEQLDRQLGQYPPQILTDTAAHFSSLSISLVRQIRGSAESGSLGTATGVQFLDGTDAHVVIAAGSHSEQALYHELFHVMETHILTDSIAFDNWNSLNPGGFSYDYSYLTNAVRDAGVYLHPDNRAFVDTYSMSYPKEDRARIMEYAMLPGNGELFRSPVLQRKLHALCDGIREAYGLQDSREVFLWEQYLE